MPNRNNHPADIPRHTDILTNKKPVPGSAATQKEDAINTLSSLCVLLVEDDKETRLMMRKILSSFGIKQIYETTSAYEAIAFLEKSYDIVDVILSDWVMPGMDGADLLKRIRSIDADIPFLMITGLNDRDSVTKASANGVTAYLTKPIQPATLEAKLRVIQAKYLS